MDIKKIKSAGLPIEELSPREMKQVISENLPTDRSWEYYYYKFQCPNSSLILQCRTQCKGNAESIFVEMSAGKRMYGLRCDEEVHFCDLQIPDINIGNEYPQYKCNPSTWPGNSDGSGTGDSDGSGTFFNMGDEALDSDIKLL